MIFAAETAEGTLACGDVDEAMDRFIAEFGREPESLIEFLTYFYGQVAQPEGQTYTIKWKSEYLPKLPDAPTTHGNAP